MMVPLPMRRADGRTHAVTRDLLVISGDQNNGVSFAKRYRYLHNQK